MRGLLLVLVLVLAGCTRTVYVDKVVEHRVEVSRPCLEVGDVPGPQAYAMARLEPGVSDGDIVFALRQEIAERVDVEEILRGLLRGCTQ